MCPMMYVRMTARPQPPTTAHNRPARPTPPRPRGEPRPVLAAFQRWRGIGDRGAVGGNVEHGDGSLEALRAGEIVECLGVW